MPIVIFHTPMLIGKVRSMLIVLLCLLLLIAPGWARATREEMVWLHHHGTRIFNCIVAKLVMLNLTLGVRWNYWFVAMFWLGEGQVGGLLEHCIGNQDFATLDRGRRRLLQSVHIALRCLDIFVLEGASLLFSVLEYWHVLVLTSTVHQIFVHRRSCFSGLIKLGLWVVS